MDRRNYCRSSGRAKLVLLVIACFLIQVDGGESAERKMPIIDAVKSLFSLPTTYDCWVLKVKALFLQQHGRPHFPPSKLQEKGSQGTTEKVKEAAMKSLEESKSAVEDSARSAAEVAEEAVEQTVKKVKNALSQHHDESQL